MRRLVHATRDLLALETGRVLTKLVIPSRIIVFTAVVLLGRSGLTKVFVGYRGSKRNKRSIRTALRLPFEPSYRCCRAILKCAARMSCCRRGCCSNGLPCGRFRISRQLRPALSRRRKLSPSSFRGCKGLIYVSAQFEAAGRLALQTNQKELQ